MKRQLTVMLILLPLMLSAQHRPDSNTKDSVRFIWEHEMAVYTAWSKIDSAWMASQYWPILKKNKLKMSCAGCEDILMHVDLNVNAGGKLTEHRIVRSDKCGMEFDEKLASAFMEYFYTLTFPDILRNRVFRVMLGTGLKC